MQANNKPTKENTTMTEQVNCQYCGRDVAIADDSVCQCGGELSTTQSLREQVRSVEAQIIALRLRQAMAVEELCRRERLRNMKRDGHHVSNFWQNVIGKPSWAGRPKQPVRSLHIDMAAFD